MKKWLMLLLCVLLAAPLSASAEEERETLTMAELNAWAAAYQARAVQSAPLNDPSSDVTEDGYRFVYDFATLYAAQPEMTAESTLRAVVVTSPTEAGPRDTRVESEARTILNAFYQENAELLGSRNVAVLYQVDLLPESFQWAMVQRDGQRMETIQYAVHEQLASGGEGYTDAGLVYTIENGLVTAIRAYGLSAQTSLSEVQAVREQVARDAAEKSYVQVDSSLNGAMLTRFDGADLVFSGLDFVGLTPEEAESTLGQAISDEWMKDDKGYIRTMTFTNCELTFLCDQKKQNPRIYMLTAVGNELEGPRSVRLGDGFASVLNRFRHGEGEFDGTSAETLYGDEETGEFGLAEYGADASATLRYGLVLDDGRQVVLYLSFRDMTLDEMLIYVAD